jgi:murein DD-endopeptidase MepM/ murein hydrolase activator NlpD
LLKKSISLLPALLCSVFLLFPACRHHQTSQQPEQKNFIKQISLTPGDTLGESLAETGLTAPEQAEIVKSLSKVFNPRACRPGDNYEVEFDTTNAWIALRYYPSNDHLTYYTVSRLPGTKPEAAKQQKDAQKKTDLIAGQVQSTLWDTMRAKNIDPETIVNFAEIFSWQVDFLTETRAGDTYKLIRDKYVTSDGIEIGGPIRAAQYSTGGRTHTAILYDVNGRNEYYTPEGKSLQRAFLRAPLQFRRISSFFTKRRYHPVLKYFRPHLGIDYAAAKGTPVSAIGEGTVTFAGWKGGFGKYIKIRHSNGYESMYGHLSGFRKGIRTGVRVTQGQLIGYVGSTGLSTGPHLDFRITKNGSFVNFLRLDFPAARDMAKAARPAFQQQAQELMDQLSAIQ